MTDLQKVEFDMLACFVDICKTLDLQYYLVCGSALGAVKYQGFIPWDDDVDVAMPRKDYEIFMQRAPQLLPEHYFLQNHMSDPQYPLLFSKLRDSRTTFIEKSCVDLDIHHGIYIDIFPLDGHPRGKLSSAVFELRKRIYKLQASTVLVFPRRWKARAVNRFFRALGYHRRTQKVVTRLSRLIASHDIASSDVICNYGNWQGRLEYAPKVQYGKGTTATFEGLAVCVPEKYDEYLTQKYGDWRADLPEEEKQGHHYHEICDTEMPYTEYRRKGNIQ